MRRRFLELDDFVFVMNFFFSFTRLKEREFIGDIEVRAILCKLPVLLIHHNFVSFRFLLLEYCMSLRLIIFS
jgi:lipoprotein NlpI